MRIHLAFAFYVLTAGIVCGIALWQWCAVLLCIGLVTALECLNTALEKVCDAVTTEYSKAIETAKDAAAGAVLCAAIFSAVVGGIIFFSADSLHAAAEFFKEYPLGAVAIVLTVPLWIKVIFRMRRTDPCQTSQKMQ